MSHGENVRKALDTLREMGVSLLDIETYAYVEGNEESLAVSVDAAFDRLVEDGFNYWAESDSADHWYQAGAEMVAEALDQRGLIAEHPNDNSQRYAMHYGIPYRSLSIEEFEAVDRAVKRFGGDAYQDGDNFFEWGENLASAAEADSWGWTDADDLRAAQSAHLVIYINKGHHPQVVHGYIEDALPLVKFLPHHNFCGRPFVVDEAEMWGENVDTAWEA